MTLRVLTRATLRSFPRSSLPNPARRHALARLNSTTATSQSPLKADSENSEGVPSHDESLSSSNEGTSTISTADARLEALMQEARAYLKVTKPDAVISHFPPLDAAEASAENIREEICEFELGGEERPKEAEGAHVAQNNLKASPEPGKDQVKPEADAEAATKKPLKPLSLPPINALGYNWIKIEEFTDYVVPLYERGWEIGFQRHHTPNAMGLVLCNRAFTFKTWEKAMEFVNAISDIAKKEKHHPDGLSLSWKDGKVVVQMSLLSHSAKRTKEISPSDPAKIPGVTPRDLRLAGHAEMIYEYKYNGEPALLPAAFRQPPWHAIHKLLNIAPKKFDKHCTACGRHGHAGEDCIVDAQGRAQNNQLPLCRKCHRHHAPMGTCPRTMKKLTKPSSPCPNCGEDHWLADCRKPQVPSGEAQAMMLPISENNSNLRGDFGSQ